MGRVHPIAAAVPNFDDASSSLSSQYMISKRETFTIWMKSLVMQGNGCTAFNANGDIVYRVENYDDKHSDEVYLMDLPGKVLFTIRERKVGIFRSNIWEACKPEGSTTPFLRVRKGKVVGKESSYKVTMQSDGICYMLEGMAAGKSAFRVTDSNGGVVAEARRKEACPGVVLGDDVLSLVVEENVDHSFVMALVTVYGLIKRQI